MRNHIQRLGLTAFIFLASGMAQNTQAITITLTGVAGGKTEGFGTEANVKAFGDVEATANGTTKTDRDPDKGKRNIKDGAINADVPDFSVGAAPDTATAGGHAKLKQKSVWGNKFGQGELRARADSAGKGSASSQSMVSTEPEGFYDQLDGDGLFNDALVAFVLEPDGSAPIISNFDQAHDSGSFSLTTSVSGDFFGGSVYSIGAYIDIGDAQPSITVSISVGWEIYLITDFSAPDILSSANFLSSGLSIADFQILWNDYITTANAGGFGGPGSFGVWFVKRDIPDTQLNTWTWDAEMSGAAMTVPEAPSVFLMIIGLAALVKMHRFTGLTD